MLSYLQYLSYYPYLPRGWHSHPVCRSPLPRLHGELACWSVGSSGSWSIRAPAKSAQCSLDVWPKRSGGFPEMGVPQNGWLIREHLLKWMIWEYSHFRKPACSLGPGYTIRKNMYGMSVKMEEFWGLWEVPAQMLRHWRQKKCLTVL